MSIPAIPVSIPDKLNAPGPQAPEFDAFYLRGFWKTTKCCQGRKSRFFPNKAGGFEFLASNTLEFLDSEIPVFDWPQPVLNADAAFLW